VCGGQHQIVRDFLRAKSASAKAHVAGLEYYLARKRPLNDAHGPSSLQQTAGSERKHCLTAIMT